MLQHQRPNARDQQQHHRLRRRCTPTSEKRISIIITGAAMLTTTIITAATWYSGVGLPIPSVTKAGVLVAQQVGDRGKRTTAGRSSSKISGGSLISRSPK